MILNENKLEGSEKKDFYKVLRSRVEKYFSSNDCSRYANLNMKVKTIIMLLIYFIPYILTVTGLVHQTSSIIILWVIMGFGMAGIGLSIMHDANHGAYSSKSWVNKLLGYTMNIIGANAKIWKLQHNLLHHNYTNIYGKDDDINPPSILRFSPHSQKYSYHKLQFLYVWIFYASSTLSWITAKEFVQAIRYRNKGIITKRSELIKILLQLLVWKIFYYSYMLVLPIYLFPELAWVLFFAFITMHLTTGLILSLIFQTAHITPECVYPKADNKDEILNNWAVHQMVTTSNYSPKSKLFSWYIGGLNYQVEHHLFPGICHIHYRKISTIVSSTAKEFDVPYHTQRNFLIAISKHVKMLYSLGRN